MATWKLWRCSQSESSAIATACIGTSAMGAKSSGHVLRRHEHVKTPGVAEEKLKSVSTSSPGRTWPLVRPHVKLRVRSCGSTDSWKPGCGSLQTHSKLTAAVPTFRRSTLCVESCCTCAWNCSRSGTASTLGPVRNAPAWAGTASTMDISAAVPLTDISSSSPSKCASSSQMLSNKILVSCPGMPILAACGSSSSCMPSCPGESSSIFLR
mmetsp:Transcript_35952/g.114282  ORF Transcript_35952/g.114282 Transcript_35952/m.114282 type:complete len:210 (-) Transcript_35952:750-1379(-)